MTAKLFMLAIDGVIVLHEIKDPLTAIGLLFGSFFVFNLHYPASASVTLEFIQRLETLFDFYFFTTEHF